ncbi:MAG: leucine-rich repeat protein [Bacteroidaceae bacterium]|nr:leucine-rich repeat protein [Bacteroidaceae bacterium]
MKKLLSCTFLMLLCACAYAYDFVVANDDSVNIYFNKVSSNTVAVTSGPELYKGRVKIPAFVIEEVDGKKERFNVTTIGEQAFFGCRELTSVELPISIVTIGDYAFGDCINLKSIQIPELVVNINEGAFVGCDELTNIYILAAFAPSAVYSAFNSVDKSACKVWVREGLKSEFRADPVWDKFENIIEYPFGECGPMATWTLIDSCLTIWGSGETYNYDPCTTASGEPSYPWYEWWRQIDRIIVSEGITSLGEGIFIWCKSATKLTLPSTLTYIHQYAFAYCSLLQDIVIPNSVKAIEEGVFCSATKAKSIIIPPSVESIGYASFWNCHSAKMIYIPASVKKIEKDAFVRCYEVENVYARAKTPCQAADYSFGDSNNEVCVLHVPEGSEEAYRNAEGWNDFKNIVGDLPTDEDYDYAGYFTGGGGNNNDDDDDDAKKYDLNDDGNVNATDVMMLYNYILSH